jgi:hypothetical protein
MRAAAAEIGISAATLCHAARECALYAPAIRGLEGCRNIGHSLCLYHAEQIRLLLAVNVARSMDLATATLQWEIFRRKIADKAPAGATA